MQNFLNNMFNGGRDYLIGKQKELDDFLDTYNRKINNKTITRGKGGSYVAGLANKIDTLRANKILDDLTKPLKQSTSKVNINAPTKPTNILGNIGKVAGPIAGAFDIPTTIKNWNAEGANLGSRLLDAAGTGAATLAGLGAGYVVPAIAGTVAATGFHNAANLARQGVGVTNLAQQELNAQQIEKQLRDLGITPTDINDLQSGNTTVQNIIPNVNTAQATPITQQQPLTQISTNQPQTNPVAPTTNTEQFIRDLVKERGIGTDNIQLNNNILNQSQPTPVSRPREGLTNINTTPNTLTPVPKASSNPSLNVPTLDNINTISNLVSGAQTGYRLPDVRPTAEEINQYANIIRTMGQGLSPQQFAQDLQNAQAADRRRRLIATGLDMLGNLSTAFVPQQENTFVPLWNGTVVQLTNQGNRERVQPYGTPAQNALSRAQSDVENVQAAYEREQNALAQRINRERELANIMSALRLSEETGIPLNIATQMKPADYVDYINPTQQAQSTLTNTGLQGILDANIQAQQDAAAMQRQNALLNSQEYRDYVKALNDYNTARMNNESAERIAAEKNKVDRYVAELNAKSREFGAKLGLAGDTAMAMSYFNTPEALPFVNAMASYLYPSLGINNTQGINVNPTTQVPPYSDTSISQYEKARRMLGRN